MERRETQVALEAVRQAAAICRRVQARLVRGDSASKDDRSPVTIADLAGQALVHSLLARAFPSDPVVSEETSAPLREHEELLRGVRELLPEMTDAEIIEAVDRGAHPGGPRGRFWTLDPIDGTKGFLRGEQYAIALALLEDGEVVLGVLGCPMLAPQGTIFVAERGRGAFEMPLVAAGPAVPIRVSSDTEASGAAICESLEASHSAQATAARVAERMGIRVNPVRMDSQCKYGIVARGDAAIYLRIPSRREYREKIWDHTAGAIVVEEAGGRVTDIEGRPLDFSAGRALEHNAGILATNGRLHDRVLDAIRTVRRAPG